MVQFGNFGSDLSDHETGISTATWRQRQYWLFLGLLLWPYRRTWTAATVACSRGHGTVVEMLIDHNSDIWKKQIRPMIGHLYFVPGIRDT